MDINKSDPLEEIRLQLELMTWPEVEAYLEQSRGVIVPIGSTEQHGPAGLIGTDAICPAAIGKVVGEQVGALVAPTLAYGNAQHHLGFAGTVTLRPSTLVATIRDVVRSLRHHGFERVFFLNGHGGNTAPLHTAFAEIHAETSMQGADPVLCTAHNWWEGAEITALLARFFGDGDGQHATAGEVSLTWHVHPECVREEVPQSVGPPENGIQDAVHFRASYPDGRIGSDCRLYSRERGAEILDTASREAAACYRTFLGS